MAEVDQIVAAMRSRGPEAWADECARLHYDPRAGYPQPTQPEIDLARVELQQWIYLVEAGEQLLRLASLLIDPRDVEGETLERIRSVLTAPPYEHPTERIDREQLLRAARQNVELACAVQSEIRALRDTIEGHEAMAARPPVAGALHDRHLQAEAQIHELLLTEGPQTARQLARQVGGMTPERISQICSYSGRIVKRRRATGSRRSVWAAAEDRKPHARRKAR